MTASEREPIRIEESSAHVIDHFCMPSHYRGLVRNVLIPHGLIIDRVEKMAQDMRRDFGSETVHFLCVLKGGEQFFSDLIHFVKKLHRYSEITSVPYTLDFIRVSSYVDTESTGKVHISGCDPTTFVNKNIVIVEDIVDTGLTMRKLVEEIRSQHPKSVKVASLLVKRRVGHDGYGFPADYIGFSIPEVFVVGYCLDYNEYFRDLEHICVINDEGKAKYKL